MEELGNVPAYRAQLIRSVLHEVRKLPDGDALLASVPPEQLQTIEAAKPKDWLPFELQMSIMAPVFEAHGPDGVCAITHETVIQAVSSPLFDLLRKGFLGLFGSDPSTILAAIPRGMRTSSRNMGRVELDTEAGSGRARTLWYGFPELMRREDVAWGQKGTYTGLLSWVGATDIEVQVDFSRLSVGEAHYDITWATHEVVRADPREAASPTEP